MTHDQVARLGPALVAYLRTFADCFRQNRTFDHFVAYARGLLSDLQRKSVEPIALASDIAVRTLQEFLAFHRWSHDQMRDQLQRRVAQQHAPPPGAERSPEELAIGLIDETGHLKKGDKTPGVQRQYCGAAGKVDNCIVTVHLGYAFGAFQTLLDRDLFLPESWSEDRKRCREAGIPDDLVHRPKWQIALEQTRRARANGVNFDFLVFDEEYGKVPQFLFELEQDGQHYVAELPPHATAWSRKPKYRSLRAEFSPSKVCDLVRFSDQFIHTDWQDVWVDRKTDAAVRWRIKAGQVYRVRGTGHRRRPTERTYWLIHAWQPETDEHKYFLSNAPPQTSLAVLIRVAFSRARIEHLFRIAKTEVGLSHFEGRSYIGLMRHLTLCQLIILFLAEQTDRLRGEKYRDHDGAGGPGPEHDLPQLAAVAPGLLD